MRVLSEGEDAAAETKPLLAAPISKGRVGLSVVTIVLNFTRFFFGAFSASPFRLEGLLVLDRNGYRMSW